MKTRLKEPEMAEAPEFVTITMAYQGKTVQAQVTDTVAQDEDCIGRFVTARMTPELMR